MDSIKIGKLIRELRKKNNLTQEQLADKVGVGFRAVSKWERGINTPELSNIYELCKIFGITKDELLSGKLNEKNNNEDNSKKKLTSRIIITISIITVFLIAITSIFLYKNNRTYAYNLASAEQEEYYINGKVYFEINRISMVINELDFKDNELKNTIIENYEYEISSNDELLFGYGFIDVIDHIQEPISIHEFTQKNKISFDATTKLTKESIIENGVVLKFKFLTKTDEIITKELTITLDSIKQ